MFRIRNHLFLINILPAFFFASACAPLLTPTPFRPPTRPAATQILSTTTPIPALYTAISTPTITPTLSGPCFNSLDFIDDITIEDYTTVLPGVSLDKQWLINNNGTCNWNSTYHLKWVGGNPLGAVQDQIMYPARAGTQVTLHILFIAPALEGTYESAWQAYDPDGIAFGDIIFMKIIVSP